MISYILIVIFSIPLFAFSENLNTSELPLPKSQSSIQNQKIRRDATYRGIEFQKNSTPFEKLFANGDLLFIRSTSSQSKALEEVTKSTWTHVGILFKAKKHSHRWILDESGAWYVLEAGPVVRMNPVKSFIAQKAFSVLRLSETKNIYKDRKAFEEKLFQSATSRLGKKYDIYFLLSRDSGQTKDDEDYCSELTWYAFAKVGYILGYTQKIGELDLSGSATKALIQKRFSGKNAPGFLQWKEQLVIPPQSQYDSPLLEEVSFKVKN